MRPRLKAAENGIADGYRKLTLKASSMRPRLKAAENPLDFIPVHPGYPGLQ